MRSTVLKLSMLCLIAFAFVSHSWAQQRMGIAMGSFELEAEGATSVPTYCLDFTRESPQAGTNYSHVLTDENTASVRIGSSTMPLQEAIDRKLISVEGQDITFGEFVHSMNDPVAQVRLHMSEEERREAANLLQAYNNAAPAKRAQMELLFAPLFEHEGDHTHLRFRNNTREKASLIFGSNAVLSPHAESIDDINPSAIKSANTDEEQRQHQLELWKTATKRQQTELQNLGYYAGTVDGLPGPQTVASIKGFQADNGLDKSGKLDHQTAPLLHQRAQEKQARDQTVSSISATSKVLLATVEHHPSQQGRQYVLSTGNGTDFASGTLSNLGAEINKRLGDPTIDHIYVDLQGFSPDEAEGAAFTLRNKQGDIDANVAVTGIANTNKSGELDLLMFSKGVRAEKSTAEIEEITEGPRKGWFRSTIDFAVRVKESFKGVTLSFVARTREMASDLAGLVLEKLNVSASASSGISGPGPVVETASVADVVRSATVTFRSRHPEIKDSDFRVEIRTQVGAAEFVKVEHFTLTIA